MNIKKNIYFYFTEIYTFELRVLGLSVYLYSSCLVRVLYYFFKVLTVFKMINTVLSAINDTL